MPSKADLAADSGLWLDPGSQPRHEISLESGGNGTYAFLNRMEDAMKTLSYADSRARYAEVLDSVVDDQEEVVIARDGHDPVVIVSLEEYEALKEMAYLMRSPANARRLVDAMERLEAGQGEHHGLLESD
jgi:antitoxin YefM